MFVEKNCPQEQSSAPTAGIRSIGAGGDVYGCFDGVTRLVFFGIFLWAVFSALLRGCVGGG